MFSLKSRTKGFPKTDKFLKKLQDIPDLNEFKKYGEAGVRALSEGTPKDSGITSESWMYDISNENGQIKVSFYNTNVNKGVNIAIILQYGHGTGTGGWVEGRDYINPAVQPVFEELARNMWEEVKKA